MAKSDLQDLAKLVSWLDGYAALSLVDPMRIEKLAKRIQSDSEKKKDGDRLGTDVAAAWKEVKNDVFDIANLPSDSEEIISASKRLNYSKLGFTFIGVGVILVYILLSALGVLVLTSLFSRIGLIVVVFAAYNAAFFTYLTMSRRFNRIVVAFYKQHGGEVMRQRKHIKVVAQRLVDLLASRIRALQENPGDYRLSLFHDDYTNLVVTGQDKNGVKYLATVKGRTAKEEA